jgi:Tol biopolymer transport system component/DNA-binding winged helix-turn-helix (wHTH) protein
MRDVPRGTEAVEMLRQNRSPRRSSPGRPRRLGRLVNLALQNAWIHGEKSFDFMPARHQYCELASVEPRHRYSGKKDSVDDTSRPESPAVSPLAPPATVNGRYAFGPFVVDPVKRTLSREDRFVPITAKTFDVLAVLLRHRDRVVSKDELLNLVWPDTTVQENNLVRQISSLRRALGQRPDQHDYIVTFPGHGYRFVATVHGVSVPSDQHAVRDVHWHVGSDSAVDLEDPSTEDEPFANQPTYGAHGDSAKPFPSARPIRSLTLVATVAAVSCALLATAVAVTLLRPEPPRAEPRPILQRITYDEAALPRDAAWAPDGQWIVYSSDAAGNADLWKQRLGDPDPIRLTSSEYNETQPDWSPDGQSIVFRSEREGGGLYMIPASGGVERIISRFGYEPLWSSDSTRIIFKRSDVLPDLPTIYLVGLDGKPPQPVRPDVLGRFISLHAAWHPDGRRISIWGRLRTGGVTFMTVPLDGGSPARADMSAQVERELAGMSPGKFVWAKSGTQVYFEASVGDTRNLWRVTVDPRSGKWSDGPERLTTGAGEETSVAVSPDGRRLVFTTTSNRTRVWAFPFDALNGQIIGQPYPVTHGSTGEVDFDARADGSKVAYYAVRAGRSELWERSMTEGQERLLLSSLDWRFASPRWSPDGAMLAFSRCATQDHGVAVAVLNANSGAERVLTKPEVEMGVSDWSKDGQAILGACRFSKSDRYSTCLIPLRDDAPASDVRVIASDPTRNLFNQRFSPDQRWISFLAHDLSHDATSTVYVISAAGGGWRPMTEGVWFDDKPRWGPDGRVLFFVSNRTGMPNVWGRRFDTTTGSAVGEPFPVTSFRSAQFQLTPRTVAMDIAITATHLLLPMSESRSDIWMLDHVDR